MTFTDFHKFTSLVNLQTSESQVASWVLYLIGILTFAGLPTLCEGELVKVIVKVISRK